MLVKHFMSRNLVTVTPDVSIVEIARKMKENNVGAVVVEKDDEIAGIITDRDVALSIVEGCEKKAEEIMSKNVAVIPEYAELYEATKLMAERNVRRLPVVDEKKKLVGMISIDDIMMILITELSNIAEVIVRPSKLL